MPYHYHKPNPITSIPKLQGRLPKGNGVKQKVKVDGAASSRKPQQGRLQVCLPRRGKDKGVKVNKDGAASSGRREEGRWQRWRPPWGEF